MHFFFLSLSVTAFSFFAATRAQAGCLQTIIKNGTPTVVDLCIPSPTDNSLTTSAPQHASNSHDSLDGCLVTVTKNGIRTVLDLCGDATPSAADSQIIIGPPQPSSDTCRTTIIDANGSPHVVGCKNPRSVAVSGITSSPTQIPINQHQSNAACLTTLTQKDGQVVVVSCGNGFASGHPPTTTITDPTATPTTICIEDRCFEVIGTFGSATPTSATPTPTHRNDEL
jgi:hypothetical protein